jgi:parvulin-like peptidyl-prolyl isomerase
MQPSPLPAAVPPEQLAGWGLVRRLEWEQRRDRWLQAVPPPPEEQHQPLVQAFLADLELRTPAAVQAWLQREAVGEADLLARAIRHGQWLAVCERHCGPQIPSYFLKRKSQLDRVSYTILPLAEQELCSELYQRIKEQEADFDTVLAEAPQHPELGERGRFGPVALAELPEGLAQLLRVSQPGQLWPPKPINGGWVLVRLEESRPAVLDQGLRRRLLLELGEGLLNQPD